MFTWIQNRLALSGQGTRDFLKGALWTTILNISMMFPAMYLFWFLQEYLAPVLNTGADFQHGLRFYVLLALGMMSVMFWVAIHQYRSTYTSVYNESAIRRIGIAEKLRVLPLAFFGKKNLSDLTATIMEDCTELEHTFSHAVPQLIASVLSLLLISLGLLFYNWKMTLALFWVAPLALGMILLSKKVQKKNNQNIYLKKRAVSEQIQEGLETVHEIKAYRQENHYMNNLEDKLNIYEKVLTKGELMTGVFVNSSQSILKLGLASVILFGAYQLSMHTLDVFTYLVFLVVASRIYAPIEEVFNNLAVLFYLDTRIHRMREIENLPVQNGEKNVPVNQFDISFSDVHFSYEHGSKVLQGVSFTARQGEITALVGPSGSGKTTAAKLAARFWDIQNGRICLGDRDIAELDPEELLQYYSVVFQDVVLFNTSIMENIRIGKRQATDEEVLQAARLARCDEFISQMPQGYHTVIGENGLTLSGGERQRISIARAMLKDAPVILLDEATASLDVENETRIQASLSALIRNKTVLIIAHRMRTIANADQVVVLDEGRVVESGTPQELEARDGLFARMLRRQLSPSSIVAN